MKYVTRDSTTRTNASTAVCQRVSRTRTESSMALPDRGVRLCPRSHGSAVLGGFRCRRISSRAKEVAGATASVEQRLGGIQVNFPAHAIDVDFDQIRERIKRFIPDVFRNFRSSHYSAGVARQIFHQRVFFGGERHVTPCAGNGLRASIQNKVCDGNFRRAELPGAAQQRAKTRLEEHTSELQSQSNLVCRLLLEKK